MHLLFHNSKMEACQACSLFAILNNTKVAGPVGKVD